MHAIQSGKKLHKGHLCRQRHRKGAAVIFVLFFSSDSFRRYTILLTAEIS